MAASNDNNQVGYDLDTHHLLQIKRVPDSLVALRNELGNHPDIILSMASQETFEACIGMVAAKLDIALDGDYDVDKLCKILHKALVARGSSGIKSYNINALGIKELMAAEMLETSNSLKLVPEEK